ncbi:carboxypeptidase-like regulatory domain-containing protein [Flavobacterium sp.]|uniref:carboxypeptidase-like regulatory domain-containing protein n=1 Tax=Flavobacterium sp. TaxID=239 RepID=UPI0026384F01|nr:carboxypeptidase-like regulatory domain-containing protein [Flavobacterium sp.]
MTKNLFLLLSLLALLPSVAQENALKNIKGKVYSDFSNLSDINVINLRSEKYAVTNHDGYFTIQVKEGDTLLFTAVNVHPKKAAIGCEDFESEKMYVKLQSVVNQLKEVVIVNYKNINAVALGIIPADQKKFTPGERRLNTATRLDAQIGLDTKFSLDPLLNAISGRTAMLKKALETEEKETWLQRVIDLYNDDFLINTLKIPIDYVKGFQYFIIENKSFLNTLALNNKSMSDFLLGQLATKFIENIANEKK